MAPRSFSAKLCGILAIILLSGLLGSRVAAQRAAKRSYDFSAQHAGDVLSLDPKFWTDINRFVFLVGGDMYPPNSSNTPLGDKFGGIESYPKLRKASQQWETQTFGTLQKLAEQLSTGTIQELLGKLEAAVHLRPKNPHAARTDFDAAASQLKLKLEEWDRLTNTVKDDLGSLVSLTLAADIQLQAVIARLPSDSRSREILEISRPRLKNAVLALTTINDHWTAISSDLGNLRKEMDTHLDSKDEFDLVITIDVGRASWDAVQRAAKTFLTNVPMQRKYLTGENYYDESPVRENAWYRLENKYAPEWKIGGLTGDMRGQRIALTNVVQKWSRMKFLKIGGGWWRIVMSDAHTNDLGMSAGASNPRPGTCFPRDVSIYYKQAQTATDLYWRFLPTTQTGWFYVVNYSLGEPSALTVDNYRCSNGPPEPPVIMRDFTNTAKTTPDVQYWRVVDAN